MADQADTAVLLTCHGTVEDLRDIPAFVQKIRRGRPAPEAVIHEVTERFELIGGSPLMEISHQQAAALQVRLDLPVRAAGRLWGPYPRDVLAPLFRQGVRRVVSLPLAPQSVHIYHDFVTEQLAEVGVEVLRAAAYGLEPELVAAFCSAILDVAGERVRDRKTAYVLTAHSLPMRVIHGGDPYQRDFEAMAEAIRDRLSDGGIDSDAISIAYQSQGMGGGDWLGPDLKSAFARAREQGLSSLVVAPVGFVAEHVETLYDIDVEAAELARELGFDEMVRMPAMNTRRGFIDALEVVARRTLSEH